MITNNLTEWFNGTINLAITEFNHNPIDGHLSEEFVYNADGELCIPDDLGGRSKFDATVTDSFSLAQQSAESHCCQLVDILLQANPLALILIFEDTDEIGWVSYSKPKKGAKFWVAEDHHCLQVYTDDPEETVEVTCMYTFVLTPEKLKSGETKLVMASMHPGTPDPIPDMSGLHEGDELSYEEVVRRGITRVKKPKTN